MYTNKDHTFVVCAYKENQHLRQTIESLLRQSETSKIILSTSTPNDYLDKMSVDYNLEMVINPNSKGAGSDWNYGYMQADSELVTLAHQDDLYESHYTEEIIKSANKYDNAMILYTDYYELRDDSRVTESFLLGIKRIMNSPLVKEKNQNKKSVRKKILAFGCPICCPAVTYVKKNVGDNPFDTKYINSCDYQTFVKLADKEGRFIYIPEKLVGHRIYAESATTKNLAENIRKKEDLEILLRFWPKPIAQFINVVYALSEKSNQI